MTAEQAHFLTRVVAGDAEVHDVEVFSRKALPEQALRLRRKRLVVGDAHADGDRIAERDDAKSSVRFRQRRRRPAAKALRVDGDEPIIDPALLVRREHVADFRIGEVRNRRLPGTIGRSGEDHPRNHFARAKSDECGDADRGESAREAPADGRSRRIHLGSTRYTRTTCDCSSNLRRAIWPSR